MIPRPENHFCAVLNSFFRAQLGITAAHGYNCTGVFLLKAADQLAGFPAALRCNSAGIDDHGVRCLSRCSRLMPPGKKDGLHGLRLILIDFASES